MGRPRILPLNGLTQKISIILVIIAVASFILAYAQDGSDLFVELTNGRVVLRPVADVASAASSAGNGGGSGVTAGVTPDAAAGVPYGRDKDGRRLFLLRYSDSTVWELRDLLVRGGASILEYVGANTLLVYAKPNVVAGADRYQALAAEYQSVSKVSPAATAVFAAAAASAASSQRASRRLAAAPSGSSGGGSVAAAAAKPAAVAASTAIQSIRGAAASQAAEPSVTSDADMAPLRSLGTWRGYVAMAQPSTANQGSNLTSPLSQLLNNNSSNTSSIRPPPLSSAVTGEAAAAAAAEDLYGATFRLVPGLSDGARRAIADSWPAAVADALGRSGPRDPCRPQAVTEGLYSQTSPVLILYFCDKDYQAGVSWVTGLSPVVWVEPVLNATLRNAVAGWILQTGNLSTETFNNPTAQLRPYWTANLRGQGVVVGLEDSGLDLSHCSFIDDRWRPGSLRTLFVGSPPRLYLPDHRKVVQYMLPISSSIKRWFGDMPFGHGTHVAGSIAGAALKTDNRSPNNLVNSRGTGSAPNARLSFFDLSADGGLFLPSPADDKILAYHYAVGARISSSSWGYDGALAVSYMEICRQFDAFTWRNPDFVSVIAAGNSGDRGYTATVTAPGTAKNVLSVGATVNHPKDLAASPFNYVILFRYRDANRTLQTASMWPYLGSGESSWIRLLSNREVPLRVASPLTACTPLVPPAGSANRTNGTNSYYNGTVVLFDLLGGNCTAEQRAGNARRAGAVGLVLIASGDGFLDSSQKVPYISSGTAYGLVTRAQGLATAALLSNSSLNITNPHMIFLTYPDVNLGIDSVVYDSAFGPFTDGRFKPDIVAPGGMVESSRSGPGISPDATSATCSGETYNSRGTSMAAPLVAGHLALVRQYFRDGYYPTGVPGDPASVGFEPSGPALKAAVLGGARSLAGGFAANAGSVLGAAPDGYQGWGRLDLSGTLPLPGLTHPLFRVAVADFGVADQNEWIYLPGVKATGTGPITATLVWHDYPGSGAAKKNLMNDLDLSYQINGNTLQRTRLDNTNNVERAELTGLTAGDRLTFAVFGRSIRSKLLTVAGSELPQRWSLLVAGHFNGTLRTPLNPLYIRPQRYMAELQVAMALPGGGCLTLGRNDSLFTNGLCASNSSAFTLVEEPAPPPPSGDLRAGPTLVSDGGFLYTVRDLNGKCLTVPGNASGVRAVQLPCNASDAGQKIGLFRNPHVNGTFYQLVPSFALRLSASAPRCLRQTSSAFVVLAPCNDDDADQLFEMRTAAAVAAGRASSSLVGRALPPSPPPPSPSPQPPAQQWYPYSLVFRTDWYPIGATNLNDYDYIPGHNGYGDDSYGTAPDDLDIIVSWTVGGRTYTMGRWAADAANVTDATGAVYGGDNKYYGTQYEIVYFPAGVTPPSTTFHVCVVWQYTQTPTVRVAMTVYRGQPLATPLPRVFNTSQPANYSCSPTTAGYLGSYDPSKPAPPPPPPSPPVPPPPPAVPYPLLFRAEWTILSGVQGRLNKPYDFDIVVAWAVGNTTFLIGSPYPAAGGGLYGGDNMRSGGAAFETVYWPVNATLPPTNTFHVCLRWNGNTKPLAQVTLSVVRAGRVTTSSKMIDTTVEWSDVCSPSAVGYIDSFWLGDTRGLIDDLRYSSCFTTPAPSPAFSLYFLAQWTAVNGTTVAGSSRGVYDWDLVVAWRWSGETYELSPYSRFVAGAVHGGDNLRVLQPTNSEAVYWPTGLTGVQPSPTAYDVCVRWFQSGRLNVTFTTYLGTRQVLRSSRVLDGSITNSKACSPIAAGYLGTYTYTESAATAAATSSPSSSGAAGGTTAGRRRVATELPGGGEGRGGIHTDGGVAHWEEEQVGWEEGAAAAAGGAGQKFSPEVVARLVP